MRSKELVSSELYLVTGVGGGGGEFNRTVRNADDSFSSASGPRVLCNIARCSGGSSSSKLRFGLASVQLSLDDAGVRIGFRN